MRSVLLSKKNINSTFLHTIRLTPVKTAQRQAERQAGYRALIFGFDSLLKINFFVQTCSILGCKFMEEKESKIKLVCGMFTWN